MNLIPMILPPVDCHLPVFLLPSKFFDISLLFGKNPDELTPNPYSLATTQNDEQLVKSLQAHFSRFGRLHVKIRRDGNGNPFSFVQFEVDFFISGIFAHTLS
jgi:hypothetical protein